MKTFVYGKHQLPLKLLIILSQWLRQFELVELVARSSSCNHEHQFLGLQNWPEGLLRFYRFPSSVVHNIILADFSDVPAKKRGVEGSWEAVMKMTVFGCVTVDLGIPLWIELCNSFFVPEFQNHTRRCCL